MFIIIVVIVDDERERMLRRCHTRYAPVAARDEDATFFLPCRLERSHKTFTLRVKRQHDVDTVISH